MKGKIKTARRKASKLHGATANFVSLVDAGANETPFTIVKNQNGVKAMGIKKRGKGATTQRKSHKPLAGSKKTAPEVETKTETSIARMEFDGEFFESEEQVREYLASAEWETDENLQVEQTDEGDFIVRANDLTDDDFDKIGEVETDEEGVSAFIGEREVEVEAKEDDADDDDASDDDDTSEDDDADIELKSDDDDTDDEEDDDADADDAIDSEEKQTGKKKPKYSKSAPKKKLSKRQAFIKARKEAPVETVRKFDAWDARWSKGNTLAKTLMDGMEWDGLPPGYYEVQAAFGSAVANIVGGDMEEGMDKQEMLNKAAMDFAEVIGGLDNFFDDFLEAEEEMVQAAYPDEKEREAIAKWADDFGDFAAGKEPAAKATVAKGVTNNVTAAIDYNAIGEQIADSVAKSLKPVIETVEDVSETVEAMATRAPTKKAHEPDDGDSAGPRKVAAKKADEAAERFGKTFLG